MVFEFATAGRIIFGTGVLPKAVPAVRELGKRALIVTGRSVTRAVPLQEMLAAERCATQILSIAGEPTIQVAVEGAQQARNERIAVIIGFGGGSALDAAKAIAALATNTQDVSDYLEVIGQGRPLDQPPLPCLAIPTTAGTGTEVTRNAVLTSPEHHVKISLRSPLMLPRLALVDPELSSDLPPEITASTGLDALTQLIEPYVSWRANPITDSLCMEGIRRAARSLRIAVNNGRNKAAREDMALASLFGGFALANAGLGAVHGFAGPVGGMFAAPHGAICAALLPRVMRSNLEAIRRRDRDNPVLGRFEDVARLLTGESSATAEDGIRWVEDLVVSLQIPRLSTYGITASDVPEIVARARRASSMKANPIELSSDELAAALTGAL